MFIWEILFFINAWGFIKNTNFNFKENSIEELMSDNDFYNRLNIFDNLFMLKDV